MENDEMVQWMVENPQEAEALIEEYRAELSLAEEKAKGPDDHYVLHIDPASTLSKLGSHRNTWAVKKEAPEYLSDNGWLGFQSDGPDRLAFFESYFSDKAQALAISDAVSLVQEAEEVLCGEVNPHDFSYGSDSIETICPQCSFEDSWPKDYASNSFQCSECGFNYIDNEVVFDVGK